MTRYQSFIIPQLIIWNDIPITDHNRSGVEVTPQKIESRQRMANGTLRVKTIAVKPQYTISWTDVPSKSAFTVDGLGGADTIRMFGISTVPFTQTLRYNGNITAVALVMPSDISYTTKKRGPNTDLWDISITLEEV